MRVLGIVPARGGSKGIPRKNIRLLAGKPLLAYTAQAALAARLDRVVLSTEDAEIAAIGRHYGLEAPFLRPLELARDDSPTLPVVQHLVRCLQEGGYRCDAVCLLQPTSPLRRAADIDGCVAMLEETGADSVISVVPVPSDYNPHWVYFSDGRFLHLSTGEGSPIPRRQDLPAAFHRDGTAYVTRTSVLLEGNSLYGQCVAGYVMDPAQSVNLDTMEDWARAERMLQALQVNAGEP